MKYFCAALGVEGDKKLTVSVGKGQLKKVVV